MVPVIRDEVAQYSLEYKFDTILYWVLFVCIIGRFLYAQQHAGIWCEIVKRNCFDLNFMQIIANKFFGFD